MRNCPHGVDRRTTLCSQCDRYETQAQREAFEEPIVGPGLRFLCAARKAYTDPPMDCNWPMCGCDESATRVIAALQECDMLRPTGRYREIELQASVLFGPTGPAALELAVDTLISHLTREKPITNTLLIQIIERVKADAT